MDVKSIVLKFPSDQAISLRIINEKQGSTAGEMHSSVQFYMQHVRCSIAVWFAIISSQN